ncbi:MAG: hypothetical protein ABJA11_02425 [Pseudolysinimonas sp.]
MKRMRRRAGLFLAVLGVVMLLAAMSVGLSGYLASAATVGARAGLSALHGYDGGFQLTIPLAGNGEPAATAAQNARITAAIHDIRADGQSVPVRIVRDIVTTEGSTLGAPGDDQIRTTLASIPGLPERALLVQGAWPRTAAEASIQADAAKTLGVSVGERLALPDGTPITITATWRVRNPDDPRWLGGSAPLFGQGDSGASGWVVIDPSLWVGTLKSMDVDVLARWIVLPDASRVTSAQLGALQSAAEDLPARILAAGHDGTNVRASGGLPFAMNPILRNIQSALAASTAPLVVVAVLGLVMLVELARMLEQLRTEENALLRARGGSRRRFALATGVEATVIAIPAAALGGGIAVAVLALGDASGEVPSLGWAGAGAVALVAIVAIGGAAGHASRDVMPASSRRDDAATDSGAPGRGTARAGRLRSTIEVGTVGLLVVAAVVAVSQFLLYGSPLTPTAQGGAAVDPLAVAAPALAIVAIGLLALSAFPLVARGLEARARRTVGLRALPLRQLARRSRSALTPILVMVFAVSGLVTAASYSGTWSASASETRTVQLGAQLRVTSASESLPATITRPIVGQKAAAPAASSEIQIGGTPNTLIALPTSKLTQLIKAVPGAVDPAAFARQLTVSTVNRPRVPTGATGLSLRFTATPARAVPSAADVVVVDSAGAERVLHAEADTTGAFTAELPAGLAPWTIHGIDVVLPAVPAGAEVALEVRASGGAGAVIPLDSRWVPVRSSDRQNAVGLSDHRVGVHVPQATAGTRVLLQSTPLGDSRLPIVISRGMADADGLSVGSPASMTLANGGTMSATVVGISPVIPGTHKGEGALVDLAALQDSAFLSGLDISAREWWVSTANPAAAAQQVTKRTPVGTLVETAAPSVVERVLESARTVVWIAGAATALLALLAVAAGLLTELRARRDEVDVLLAVGIGPVEQARNRAIEWGILLVLGVVAGLVDGFLVSVVLVPGLARTAVANPIGALGTSFQVDTLGGALAFTTLLLALAALLLLVVVTVRRQAREGSR